MLLCSGIFLDDHVIEVLSRLPVKSLLRFRCVCKDWYSLIRNPSFISKHLRNDHYDRLLMIYFYYDFENEDEIDSEDSHDNHLKDPFCLFPDETLTDISFKEIVLVEPMSYFVGGPYDGIFCLRGPNNRLALINLSTRESRSLPRCKLFLPRESEIFCSITGFGLDITCNDYKLVMISTLWKRRNEKSFERPQSFEYSHVAVYNLRTNSWENFKASGTDQYTLHVGVSGGTCLDGICYWLTSFVGSYYSVILSFNLGDVTLREIRTPHDIPFEMKAIMGFYNNFISLLLLDDAAEKCFEIWVMNERHCWSKMISVGPLTDARRPLGLWKKGAFFLHSSSEELVLYDPSTHEIRELGVKSSAFEVYIVKESLIPIKGEGCLLQNLEIPWHILGVHLTNDS